jgi:hypothetical protein
MDSASGLPPVNAPAFGPGGMPNPNQPPVLTFEGKRYDLNNLPEDIKELVRGMQVADAQLRMHEDTLKVLAIGRQAMAMQLNDRLQSVTPMGDAEPEG